MIKLIFHRKVPLLIRLAFLVMLIALSNDAHTQVQNTITGDTVRVQGNNSTTELLLQNATQNTKGFLYNKKNGTTEFRKGLVKLTDSTYIIGGDTLLLNNSSLNNNVFYVSRNFQGIARALIGGFTIASISSPNTSYTSQLGKARAGNIDRPYPDPFSARNAARDALVAGKIKSAVVVVLEGNKYTVGYKDSTKNGSEDGMNANGRTISDIQFNNAYTNNFTVGSLMIEDIDMYFGIGTVITYINSKTPIYCYYNQSNEDVTTGIYGSGSFYQVYGQNSMSSANFSFINNRYSKTVFHAHEVILQQWKGFEYNNFLTAEIKIDNLLSTDANTFSFESYDVANQDRILDISVKNCRFGRNQTPYPDTVDWWFFLSFYGDVVTTDKTIINVHVDNLYMNSLEQNALFAINDKREVNNVQLTVDIGNLIQKNSATQNPSLMDGLIGNEWATYKCENNHFVFNIQNADIEAPLFGAFYGGYEGNKNNSIDINVGYLQKNHSVCRPEIFIIGTRATPDAPKGEPWTFRATGFYKSFDSGALISNYGQYANYTNINENHFQFSGTYESAVPNQPVVHLYESSNKTIQFHNATLINDGLAKSVMADQANIPVYIKNVHANGPVDANLAQAGDTIKVVPDLIYYR